VVVPPDGACFYWSLLLAVGVLPASEFRTHGSPIAVKHKQATVGYLHGMGRRKYDCVLNFERV
jgi:hypothetical protein